MKNAPHPLASTMQAMNANSKNMVFSLYGAALGSRTLSAQLGRLAAHLVLGCFNNYHLPRFALAPCPRHGLVSTLALVPVDVVVWYAHQLICGSQLHRHSL